METKKDHPYTWRIELAKTEKYWDGWFRGLSNLFLSCPIPKLLLLAGVDRLDKDLTIGQMQGKFQMQVLPQCGHAVHEDAPDKVSLVLSDCKRTTVRITLDVTEDKSLSLSLHCLQQLLWSLCRCSSTSSPTSPWQLLMVLVLCICAEELLTLCYFIPGPCG
uniref:Isoform 3 of Protein phosphatase methylesterase 1 n=2 Tax=Homo sapiens TaxID=9606 RepID=Q9Y570-3|nr:unnamed protein product [Homo sapiens]